MLIMLRRLIGAVHTLAVELQASGVDIRWLKQLGRACAAALAVIFGSAISYIPAMSLSGVTSVRFLTQ